MTINFQTANLANSPYKSFYNFVDKKSTVQPQFEQENTIATVAIGDVEEGDKVPRNRKKLFGIIGVSVGSGLLLTLIALLTLSKGNSGHLSKRFAHLSSKIKSAIQELSSETEKLTLSQKVKLRCIKAIQPVADIMQASSNFTAVKDSVSHKILKKFRMETIVAKINNFFKNNVVLKTKNDAYQKAELSVLEFCKFLNQVSVETKNPQLQQNADKILELYAKTFSTTAHFNRSEKLWQRMQGLDDIVYNKLFKQKGGFFRNLKQLKSYVTLDIVAVDRKVLVNELLTAKSGISNDIDDVYALIKQSFNDLKLDINPKNEKAVGIIKEITQLFKDAKKLSGENEPTTRQYLTVKVMDLLIELRASAEKFGEDRKTVSLITDKIENMFERMSDKAMKKGLAQDTITLIKSNPQQYAQAKKLMEKMNGRLNTAISSEITSFEKLAELQVGSVPTDILGILVPSAIATGLIINSDNKNERISTTLTQGIPILGGIGVAYYGTTRGFTGVKNLILGIVTTLALNTIGTKADELFKKYVEKQNALKTAFDSWTKLQSKQLEEKLS